jgi:hypothetical protein
MRTFASFPRSKQERAAREFKRAIQAREKQWFHERNIEEMLSEEDVPPELQLDISDCAAAGASGDDLRCLGDLFMQLNEQRPAWLLVALADGDVPF